MTTNDPPTLTNRIVRELLTTDRPYWKGDVCMVEIAGGDLVVTGEHTHTTERVPINGYISLPGDGDDSIVVNLTGLTANARRFIKRERDSLDDDEWSSHRDPPTHVR